MFLSYLKADWVKKGTLKITLPAHFMFWTNLVLPRSLIALYEGSKTNDGVLPHPVYFENWSVKIETVNNTSQLWNWNLYYNDP